MFLSRLVEINTVDILLPFSFGLLLSSGFSWLLCGPQLFPYIIPPKGLVYQRKLRRKQDASTHPCSPLSCSPLKQGKFAFQFTHERCPQKAKAERTPKKSFIVSTDKLSTLLLPS
jgi:hypothetical protein